MPGGEVAEAEGESDADAVGERLVPAVGVTVRSGVNRGTDQGGKADGGALGGGATARTGAGMEEEGCQCDDCGAGGGCRELEDPGHVGSLRWSVQERTFKRTASRVVTPSMLVPCPDTDASDEATNAIEPPPSSSP